MIDLGPPKRLTFAARAAVSRFPIYSSPLLGGPDFPRAQFLKKETRAAAASFFVFVRPVGDWCRVGGIDRSVGWEAYLCIQSFEPASIHGR